MFFNGDKMKQVFLKAKKERFAIVASNIAFDGAVRSILQAADNVKSDVLIQISTGACKYASGINNVNVGASVLSSIVKILSAQYRNSGAGLHIDHATPNYFDFVKFCIENGLVSSVMIDASKEKMEDNIRITKEVVYLAHKHNIIVEGEIGYIKGQEDEIVSDEQLYTNPDEALEFVKKTDVDLFAASIGTNHGVTKGKNVHLRLDLIEKIDKLLIENGVERGIVLHGASGLTKEQQQGAISRGVVKINKDTRYQMEYASAVQKFWEENKDAIVCPKGMSEDDYIPDKKRFDPRKWLIKGEQAIQRAAENLMDICGSKEHSILL